MREASLLAVMLAVVAVPAAPGFAADEVFDRTLPLRDGGALALENVNGSITVTGWDREEVSVHAVKSAKSPSELALAQIDIAAAPGRVAVNTRNLFDQDNRGADVTVTYSLRVPRRIWLQHLATVNGAVRVTGVNGAGELHSVNGDLDVSDSSGVFSGGTTNGDIRVELARLATSSPLSLETVNGSIELAVPGDTPAALDVRCWNGDFHSELPVSIVGAYRAREFQGRLNGGDNPVRLHTVNGGIRIVPLARGI